MRRKGRPQGNEVDEDWFTADRKTEKGVRVRHVLRKSGIESMRARAFQMVLTRSSTFPTSRFALAPIFVLHHGKSPFLASFGDAFSHNNKSIFPMLPCAA